MNGALDIEARRWSRSLRTANVVWVSVVVVVTVAALLWLRGASYYVLPLSHRVDHADYDVLSPGRTVGRVYGAVGLLLILINLAYLFRRQFPHLPIGRMRLWLDAHVVTGITASLFVAFHTAFQLRSPVAVVTAVTLAITVATGVVGRFFYAFVPRIEGQLLARVVDLAALVPATRTQIAVGLEKLAPSQPAGTAGVFRVLRTLPTWRAEARARRELVLGIFEQCATRVPQLERTHALPLAREVARLAAREVYAAAGRELLRAWRPWHRLCALTMVAGVLLHVGVATFFGYAWDFGT